MQPIKHMQAMANEGSIIAGRWFCCIFNVQVGVVIFSSMGCSECNQYNMVTIESSKSFVQAMMLTVTLLNLGAEENPEALPNRSTYYSVLYCYTIPMLMGFCLLYVGANKPDVNFLIIGLAIQCAFGVYWLTITVMSFIDEPKYVYSVCIDNRCPDTLWLYNTEWRTYGNECIVHVDELLVAPPEELKDSKRQNLIQNVSAELPEVSISDIGDGYEKDKVPETTAQPELNVGGRSLYNLHNDSNDIQDLMQINQTKLVSRNHNGTTYHNNSAEELNHTNEYENDDDSGNVENLGRNSTLLTEKNQSSGTTRFARLAGSAEDTEDILQALLLLLSKKPFANLNEAELRAVLYGSRVLGCTENIEHSRAKCIIGAIIWFVFVVYGNLGAFMLIIELRRMAATGELQDALEIRTTGHQI